MHKHNGQFVQSSVEYCYYMYASIWKTSKLINLQVANEARNTQFGLVGFFREVLDPLLVDEICDSIFPFHSRQRLPNDRAHLYGGCTGLVCLLCQRLKDHIFFFQCRVARLTSVCRCFLYGSVHCPPSASTFRFAFGCHKLPTASTLQTKCKSKKKNSN